MCKGKHTHTYNRSHCDSHNHAGGNVSLFVKQKSLTESISRQGEWRILDSIKLTAFPIGTPLTGPLFNQTVCVSVYVKEGERDGLRRNVLERVCVCLSWGWTHFSPSALRSASSVKDLDQHKHSQNLIPPSAVPTKPHTWSPKSGFDINAADS